MWQVSKDEQLTARHCLLLTLATLSCLLPFVARPFNIDEPLFLWAARQIQSSPLDFYGFGVNWYGTLASASQIIKNPPLASYLLALAGALFGWSESALHLVFLLPALAAVAGSYLLARELSPGEPLVAALCSLLCPAFVLSGATVMCDTLMLAFYLWAVFFWLRGSRRQCHRDLLLAALLVSLCSLTKYFGITLIPLLCVYSLSRKGGRGGVLFLALPVAVLFVYQWWTGHLYGRGLLFDAAGYAQATKAHAPGALLASLITGLSFCGGCLLPGMFLAPRVWGWRRVALALPVLPFLAWLLSLLPVPERPQGASALYFLQLALFVLAGVQVLLLAVRDLSRRRDAEALLLLLWVTGTFVFASLVNWSVNGRSVLPIAPALGLLIARALAQAPGQAPRPWRQLAAPFALAWLASLSIAWSDYSLARSAREAASEISRHFGRGPQPLLFQGHWGFQYYMEQLGGEALDGRKRYPRPLVMVMPNNNVDLGPAIMSQGVPLALLRFATTPFLTDMNIELGAGFYSDVMGPLPFSLGRVPDEQYLVARLR